MSDLSSALELEGDMDDLEGEADITDWTSLTSESGGKKHSAKLSSGKEKVRGRSALAGDKKFNSAKQGRASTTKQAFKSNSSSGTQNRNSHLLTKPGTKLPPKKQSEDSKNINPSHVGDIADVIGIFDSNRKKTDSDVKMPSKSADLTTATERKRKLSFNEDTDSSKPKKINDEKEGKDNSSKEGEVKVGGTEIKQETETDTERKPSCSEEDARNIDTELVEEMIGSVKQNIMPKYGDKYTVRFSPVELADLADETVQKLVISQPNMVFYFKRQGKLKKKKGYAEVYFSQIQDARIFLQKLVQIKLVEPHMDVTITVSKPKKDDEVLSLVMWLNKNSQLLKLTKSSEDAAKVLPGAKREQFKLEKVPASVNALTLRTLFPFATEVIFSVEKKKMTSAYRGPVFVHYTSAGWLEAMLDCCSDFTYNGFTFSVQYARKKLDIKAKPAPDIKKDAGGAPDRRSSGSDKLKQGDTTKTVKDGNSSSGSHKSEITATVGTPQDASVDDDISHMTLNVCTGMMESLNKLRQLGTDNPNVMKILQMQNELATLQQSLSQSKDQSHNTSLESQDDPWTVSAADDIADKQDGCDKGQDKKLSKEKRKQDKETRAEKQKREMEDLQRMFEEADEAKRQSEEKAKKQIELEKQKMKDLEEKRKSTWARRMIEDAKQSAPQGSGESASSKEEVQRILKIIGSKRKDAEEAKKLEEEIKEKEKLKVSTAQDEALSSANPEECDDGLHDEPAMSEDNVEQHSADIINEAVAWSPDRNLHDGAPVYSEDEFKQICSENAAGTIPLNHYIQVTYYANRRCPVDLCPHTKYFKTASSFAVHWDVFHEPNVTVKFCQKCNAYFTTVPELEAHLTNRHSISDPETVKKMSEEAREKVVSNPSFRDPGRYLPPVV